MNLNQSAALAALSLLGILVLLIVVAASQSAHF